MMKAAILTDSTASLTQEEASKENLFIVPLSFTFEDGEVQMDSNDPKVIFDFYSRLKTAQSLPKSSQPSPTVYLETLDKIKKEGYDTVFAIHLSSQLSGTYQSALSYGKDYQKDLAVYVIDSKASTLPLGSQVLTALEMVDKGYSVDEILEKLHYMADETAIYIAISDIQNLVKGGRLNSGMGFLASALKITPMLMLKNGKLEVLGKVRTQKRAIIRLKHYLLEEAEKYEDFELALVDSYASITEDFLKELRSVFPNKKIRTGTITPVLGVYSGNNALACAVIPKFNFVNQLYTLNF